MLDSFELVRPAIEAADVPGELGLERGGYGVVTLHRPSNVDEPGPAHPPGRRPDRGAAAAAARLPGPSAHREAARRRRGLDSRLARAGVRLIEPLPYVRFMSLVTGAAAAITDSGGIQEETTYLGIPCLTLRENTERPITISEGTNRLVNARDPAARARAGADRAAPGALPRTVGRQDRRRAASRICGRRVGPVAKLPVGEARAAAEHAPPTLRASEHGPDRGAASRRASSGAVQLSSIILMIAEKSLPAPPSSAKRA